MKKTYIAPIMENEDMTLEQMISESLAIDLTQSGDEALAPGDDENLWDTWLDEIDDDKIAL